jgi:hypothetical protein
VEFRGDLPLTRLGKVDFNALLKEEIARRPPAPATRPGAGAGANG